MDLIKELEQIKEKNFSHAAILKSFKEEKAQIEKKEHIIKTLKIVNDIENYIRSEDFSLYKIAGIELDCCDEEDGKYQSISFSFFREDGSIVLHDTMKKEYPQILQKFRKIFNDDEFKNLKDLLVKTEFLNQDFVIGGGIIELALELVRKEVLELFLSKELKSILDYSQMQVKLDNKQGSSKKLKV